MADLESIRPVVLQQPNREKLQLELKITQVADDTTAIKSFEKGADISIASFDYATGIAVFLALCATGLTYWFGVRSFKLTRQSFETVIEQIKVSERSASDLNVKLFEQQKELQKFELDFRERMAWNESVLTISSQCNVLINDFIFKADEIIKFYIRSNSRERSDINSPFGIRISELENINHQLILNVAKLDLYLEESNDKHEHIIKLLDFFTLLSNELIKEIYNNYSFENFEFFSDLSYIQNNVGEILTLKNWQSRERKNRLEILSLLMREISQNFKNNLIKKAA